jgi:hypothetical protein
VAAKQRSNRVKKKLAGWEFGIVFLVSFALYISTLAPTIFGLDSAELTVASATLGITRSTGYPLYILSGFLWSKLPLGDVGYRMNLFSAFTGSLTIVLGYAILRRLRVGAWASISAMGLLAVSPFFWSLSLVAEVYTMQTALMSGLLLALLWWQETPSPTRLGLVSFLMGLCLCHHGASVLLLPGVVFFVLAVGKRSLFTIRNFGMAVFGLLLGLAPLLYLPLRYLAQPVFNYAGIYDGSGVFHPLDLTTWSGFWTEISGRQFASMMGIFDPSQLSADGLAFLKNLARSFFGIGVLPGLLGVALLFKHRWKLAVMLALMFFAHAIFFLSYAAVDKDLMFLPDYIIWAVWAGTGYQWILDRVSVAEKNARLWVPQVLLGACFLAAVILALVTNFSQVDLSHNDRARVMAESVLREAAPNALLFGYWNIIPALQYMQLVEGYRPDVQAVNLFLVDPQAVNAWVAVEIKRRPVYLLSVVEGSASVQWLNPLMENSFLVGKEGVK